MREKMKGGYMMDTSKVGVLNEQGYFGEGFGFTEAAEEDKDKVKSDLEKNAKDK